MLLVMMKTPLVMEKKGPRLRRGPKASGLRARAGRGGLGLVDPATPLAMLGP
jgi:hypothetical protein